MISVYRAKRILGKSGEDLPDEEIELLINQCYVLAEIMFEQAKLEEKLKKGVRKNDKFKINY